MNKLRNISKKIIDSKAPAGNVITHDRKIELTLLTLIVEIPSTKPIPITAPTSVWVVDTGISSCDARTTVKAAANCAAKPLLGVNLTIFSPIVFITRYPRVASPITIPAAPKKRIQRGVSGDTALPKIWLVA